MRGFNVQETVEHQIGINVLKLNIIPSDKDNKRIPVSVNKPILLRSTRDTF